MVDTLVLGTSANAWEFESLHAQFIFSTLNRCFFSFKRHKFMITPITYNTQNNYNQTFTGLNFENISPLKKYLDKTFNRFAKISRSKWHEIQDDLRPNFKVVRKEINGHIFNAFDVNPYNEKKYIIFYHGVGQNITSNQPLYKSMVDKGYGVLSCEYGSFGDNTEDFSKKSIKRTGKMALDYLHNKNIDEIGIVGYSMGSFPALETTVQNSDAKFLVLISPFNSLKNELEKITSGKTVKLPKLLRKILKKFPFLLRSLDNTFNTKSNIKKIKAPTFLIHSSDDKLVPLKSTQELADKSNSLKKLIVLEKGGHQMDDYKLEAFQNLPIQEL